jgi:hypothetical protein
MTTLRRRAALLTSLIITIHGAPVLSQPAQAQPQPSQGFALNRFEPSERGSEWFVLESLDLRGEGRVALGVVGDWGHKPLVLYATDGSEKTLIVRDQLFVHVGGGVILANRFRLSASFPIAVYEAGDPGTVGSTTYAPPSSASIGDLRLGADARLIGEFGDPFTAALGLEVQVPTGQQGDYTGDGKVRLAPRLLGAGEVGPFVYALKLGVQYRALDGTFADSPIGTELVFGAAAGARTAEKNLVIGPELYGSTVVTSGDAFFKKRSTPLELIVGGHYTVANDFRFGAGIGPGLTRGFGTPQLRVLASVEWIPAIVAPPPPPSDRDNDGVPDSEDACPDTPGVRTDDLKTNGCPPPPPDRDKDGILDPEDACPDAPGPKNEDPKKNGCPEARIEAGGRLPRRPASRRTIQTNGCRRLRRIATGRHPRPRRRLP